MTWWVWVVTAGLGPVSYLEMAWLALTAGAVYYVADCLVEARRLRARATDRVEVWIAEGYVAVECLALLHQGCFGLIGVVSAASGPPPAALEPRQAAASVVFVGALMLVQASSLVAARRRRLNRLRIARELARPTGSGVAVTPMIGGRRHYDIDPIDTED